MESVPPLSASLPIPILALRPQDSSTNSMDRGGSSLPVEVWEHIIDLMDSHPRPGHLAWIQWDHLSDVDTTHFCYRMSALTCHAWLRQSRHNLYRVVKFGTREQFDLFLRTITNHPSESLACLVQCLVIPNRWGGSYIPYACDTLVTKLCNLRCLCYYRDSHSSESTAQSAPAWSTGYPLRYNILIARFPIVELTIQSWRSDSTRPESIINIFRLIWSLRDLQVLSLHVPWMHPEAEAEVSRRLRALYRQTICAKLRTLTLLVRVTFQNACCWFGTNMTFASGNEGGWKISVCPTTQRPNTPIRTIGQQVRYMHTQSYFASRPELEGSFR